MGLSRALRVAAVLSGGGIAATQACSLVTSYDGFTPEPAAQCGQRIPTAPAGGDDGDVGELIGAMRAVRFVQEKGTSPLGYDLDQLCTKAACKPVSPPLGPAKPFGVDNAVGQFIGPLYKDGGGSDDIIHALYGLVLKLEGWNGKSDDTAVRVSLYNVVGVNGSTDGGASADFSGSDTFIAGQSPKGEYLLDEKVLGSTFADSRAYVTGNLLVAHFAKLRFRYVAPNNVNTTSAVEITLDESALVGKVQRAGATGLKMDDAQIVGRMLDSELLRALGEVGICRDPSRGDGGVAYATAKGFGCSLLDMPAQKASDGKNATCAAASFAIGATFAPAKLAPVAAPATLGPDICGDPSDKCP